MADQQDDFEHYVIPPFPGVALLRFEGNAFSDLRPKRGALRGAHLAQLAATVGGRPAVRGDPGGGRGRPLFGARRPQIHRHRAVSRSILKVQSAIFMSALGQI